MNANLPEETTGSHQLEPNSSLQPPLDTSLIEQRIIAADPAFIERKSSMLTPCRDTKLSTMDPAVNQDNFQAILDKARDAITEISGNRKDYRESPLPEQMYRESVHAKSVKNSKVFPKSHFNLANKRYLTLTKPEGDKIDRVIDQIRRGLPAAAKHLFSPKRNRYVVHEIYTTGPLADGASIAEKENNKPTQQPRESTRSVEEFEAKMKKIDNLVDTIRRRNQLYNVVEFGSPAFQSPRNPFQSLHMPFIELQEISKVTSEAEMRSNFLSPTNIHFIAEKCMGSAEKYTHQQENGNLTVTLNDSKLSPRENTNGSQEITRQEESYQASPHRANQVQEQTLSLSRVIIPENRNSPKEHMKIVDNATPRETKNASPVNKSQGYELSLQSSPLKMDQSLNLFMVSSDQNLAEELRQTPDLPLVQINSEFVSTICEGSESNGYISETKLSKSLRNEEIAQTEGVLEPVNEIEEARDDSLNQRDISCSEDGETEQEIQFQSDAGFLQQLPLDREHESCETVIVYIEDGSESAGNDDKLKKESLETAALAHNNGSDSEERIHEKDELILLEHSDLVSEDLGSQLAYSTFRLTQSHEIDTSGRQFQNEGENLAHVAQESVEDFLHIEDNESPETAPEKDETEVEPERASEKLSEPCQNQSPLEELVDSTNCQVIPSENQVVEANICEPQAEKISIVIDKIEAATTQQNPAATDSPKSSPSNAQQAESKILGESLNASITEVSSSKERGSSPENREEAEPHSLSPKEKFVKGSPAKLVQNDDYSRGTSSSGKSEATSPEKIARDEEHEQNSHHDQYKNSQFLEEPQGKVAHTALFLVPTLNLPQNDSSSRKFAEFIENTNERDEIVEVSVDDVENSQLENDNSERNPDQEPEENPAPQENECYPDNDCSIVKENNLKAECQELNTAMGTAVVASTKDLTNTSAELVATGRNSVDAKDVPFQKQATSYTFTTDSEATKQTESNALFAPNTNDDAEEEKYSGAGTDRSKIRTITYDLTTPQGYKETQDDQGSGSQKQGSDGKERMRRHNLGIKRHYISNFTASPPSIPKQKFLPKLDNSHSAERKNGNQSNKKTTPTKGCQLVTSPVSSGDKKVHYTSEKGEKRSAVGEFDCNTSRKELMYSENKQNGEGSDTETRIIASATLSTLKKSRNRRQVSLTKLPDDDLQRKRSPSEALNLSMQSIGKIGCLSLCGTRFDKNPIAPSLGSFVKKFENESFKSMVRASQECHEVYSTSTLRRSRHQSGFFDLNKTMSPDFKSFRKMSSPKAGYGYDEFQKIRSEPKSMTKRSEHTPVVSP